MNRFHIIDDGAAILRVKRETYHQADIYRRESHIYAKIGGGFIRLLRGGGTSKTTISWLEVEGPGVEVKDNLPQYVEPKQTPPSRKAATQLSVVGA